MRDRRSWGLSDIRVPYLGGGPCSQGILLGSILGVPYFRKPPYETEYLGSGGQSEVTK